MERNTYDLLLLLHVRNETFDYRISTRSIYLLYWMIKVAMGEWMFARYIENRHKNSNKKLQHQAHLCISLERILHIQSLHISGEIKNKRKKNQKIRLFRYRVLRHLLRKQIVNKRRMFIFKPSSRGKKLEFPSFENPSSFFEKKNKKKKKLLFWFLQLIFKSNQFSIFNFVFFFIYVVYF